MPSLREGLPISTVEAIACGASAVLTDKGGLADIARETDWVIVTSTNAESLATGIAQMASIPSDERRRRALLDSNRIREVFSVQHGVRSMIDAQYGKDRQRNHKDHSGEFS
jgi:glycosyltransferase involved in cell wall biosynthesis